MGAEDVEDVNLGERVRAWLNKHEKSLEFLHCEPQAELTVSECLAGPPTLKICDPYESISEPPLKNRILYIENNARPERLTGQTAVKLSNGDELTGCWRGGKRVGLGSISGPRLERIGVSRVVGYYWDGVLEGQGKVLMTDDTVLEGWFQLGYLHGPARGTCRNGKLQWLGWYRNGLATGVSWRAVRGQGWLVGRLDAAGTFTGDEMAYLYPDLSTALVGCYREGQLVAGRAARLTSITMEDTILVPHFTFSSDMEYRRWVSSSKAFSCPPLLPDPYESGMVRVAASSVPGAGEGLFARVDLPTGVLVAYYNGLRMRGQETLEGEETGYAIFVEVNLRKDKNAEHMDIPPKYQSTASYCASLAHKLNHSFTPNCDWDNAEHPVFGLVPAVRTLEPIPADSELTIHYRIDMANAADWYRESWERHTSCSSEKCSEE